MNDFLDQMIAFFQHPFWMIYLGLIFWFSILWSWNRNKNGKKNFWDDQKDEIVVSCIGGFIFLIFSMLVLQAYDHVMDRDTPTEFHQFYYLLVGPAIERLYKLVRPSK